MKLAMQVIEFDFIKSRHFEFEVKDPGTPIHTCVDYQAASKIIKRGGAPDFVPIAKLYVQIDPDAPPRRRRYIALPESMMIETEECVLGCVGVFTNPVDGARCAVFEIAIPADYVVASPGEMVKGVEVEGPPVAPHGLELVP